MSNILDKIIANKKIEVHKHKQQKSLSDLEILIEKQGYTSKKGKFSSSIADSTTGIIAEFKRRSPSRGWIFETAAINDVVPKYSTGGASAISVLTDIDFFGGTLADLEEASLLTRTPLLRKDFVVDEYQLYQSVFYGASAILLIAAALDVEQTKYLASKAKQLGLDILLEIHNEKELEHINEFVDVIGVNNRDLTTFITDVQISFDLVDKIPAEFVRISESGISNPQTVIELRQAGYRGFLMGENFMKTDNPGEALSAFIKQLS